LVNIGLALANLVQIITNSLTSLSGLIVTVDLVDEVVHEGDDAVGLLSLAAILVIPGLGSRTLKSIFRKIQKIIRFPMNSSIGKVKRIKMTTIN
jgi:hypothetical protein